MKIHPFSKRGQVYAKHGKRCVNCGASKNLTLDHIKPLGKGGEDTVENLQPLCGPCNHFKGDKHPFTFPPLHEWHPPMPTPPPHLIDMSKPIRPVSQYHKTDWTPRRKRKWLAKR